MGGKAGLANVHASYDPGWGTLPIWWSWVEVTMNQWSGAEVFDPCPASWKPGDPSGLDIEWRSPCYVNHPGSPDGSAATAWWAKAVAEMSRLRGDLALIWCAFSIEQFRRLKPAVWHLPGYLVLPDKRQPFVRLATGDVERSPNRWAVWWSNVPVATPPVPCEIVRTG